MGTTLVVLKINVLKVLSYKLSYIRLSFIIKSKTWMFIHIVENLNTKDVTSTKVELSIRQVKKRFQDDEYDPAQLGLS